MKKILLYGLGSLLILSCSGEDKKDDKKVNVDICDCINAKKEMQDKLKEVGDDEEKINQIKEEYEDVKAQCKELTKGMSPEERKSLIKEAEKCN